MAFWTRSEGNALEAMHIQSRRTVGQAHQKFRDLLNSGGSDIAVEAAKADLLWAVGQRDRTRRKLILHPWRLIRSCWRSSEWSNATTSLDTA